MDLGYARVSTTKQDLDRQIVALEAAGIPPERIYVDKKSGATTNRPGLQAVIEYARDGDVIVVHTLDRLGRTVRDTLNLIHDLAARGVGIRNLADPIKVDSTSPADPMAQLAVVLLALFAQMERTYSLERAAGARAAATAKGRRIGRPSVVDADKLAYATHDTPSPRSPPRAASPAPASTATSRPARPNRSPQDNRPSDRRALSGGSCTTAPQTPLRMVREQSQSPPKTRMTHRESAWQRTKPQASATSALTPRPLRSPRKRTGQRCQQPTPAADPLRPHEESLVMTGSE